MRIQYQFEDSKDFFEKSGDFCLFFGRKTFGFKQVGTLNSRSKPLVEKVKVSVNMIFLFLLTLPISSLLSLAGVAMTALSKTHSEKHKKLLTSQTSVRGKIPPIPILPPGEKQRNKLTKWQSQYHKISERFHGNPQALRGALRDHRVSLYRETKRLCELGHYYSGTVRITFDVGAKERMIDNTVRLPLQAPLAPLEEGNRYPTEIEIVEVDTFQLGEQYLHAGYKPVALNMANANTPGGGVEGGCGAQEESLFRRSNYFQALYPVRDSFYPIPDTSVIYTPEVQIFRTPEAYLEQNLDDRQPGYEYRLIGKMDMIACAFPDLRRNTAADNYEDDIRSRIHNILRVSFNQGHDALVLGAIGCGAFANDPRIVARVFKEELQSDEFRGRFKMIGFGILYPRISYNQEQLNLIDVFSAEFNTL